MVPALPGPMCSLRISLTLLADFAAEVAQRYPWLELFTPINEPFTTARISGLYGLWHPHETTEAACFRLVVAECLAIARSMNSIRAINPSAKLIQTEDVGRVFSTPHLQDQARYENERRWLSLDLLTGRVDCTHPFFERLLAAGADSKHLDELVDTPCPPDLIGLDYYLTSDRMLDERTDRYPLEPVGGNGRESYVDIAAVRSDLAGDRAGLLPRVKELWQRYHLPIAVTELHNGCTREEQLRWLVEGWQAAQAAKSMGIDIRAVTSWSLFGAVDWNSMLVRREGYYEPGAFDARWSPPKPTAIAHAIMKLSAGNVVEHPVLDRPGWWRDADAPEKARPILLAGFGHLISIIEECCHIRRLRVVAAAAHTDLDDLAGRLDAWAVVETYQAKAANGLHASSPLYLYCRYPDAGALSVEAAQSLDWHGVVNAFLDMMVDQAQGEIRLTSAAPANQYELVEVQRQTTFKRAG